MKVNIKYIICIFLNILKNRIYFKCYVETTFNIYFVFYIIILNLIKFTIFLYHLVKLVKSGEIIHIFFICIKIELKIQ